MPTLTRPWGVTPALVASRIQSFKLDVNTSPSLSDVEAIIQEEADMLAGELRRVGVGPDLEDGSETLGIVRRALFRLVIAQVDTLRGRKDTDMASIEAQAVQAIERMRVGPQGLGDGAKSSRNHRVATSRSAEEQVRRYNDADAPLAVRLATRGRT